MQFQPLAKTADRAHEATQERPLAPFTFSCGCRQICNFTITIEEPDYWHWPLDEGEGVVAADLAEHRDDGILIGAPQWVQGQSGSALACGGQGYVQVADTEELDLQESITLAMWVKPDPLGQPQILLSKDNAYEFEIGKVPPMSTTCA